MAFVVKSRVEPTIFFIEKISFSLKLFSGYFYGQSFIKTVRGPYGTGARNGSSPLMLPCNYQLSKSIVHEIKFGNTVVM